MTSIVRQFSGVLLFVLLVMPLGLAGASGSDGPRAMASASVKKTVKKLKQTVGAQQEQLAALEQQLAELEGAPGPPSGTAGGDLAGSYPNPSIGGSAVGSPEVANNSLGILDVGNNAVGTNEIVDGAVGVADHAVTPAARVTGAAVQVPDGTETVVPFDSESAVSGAFDNGNLHSNVTNNSRLTAPVTGIYWIHGQAQWQADADDDVVGRGLTIRTSTASRPAVTEQDDNTVGEPAHEEISTVARLQAGEFVELLAVQDNTDADSRAIQAQGSNSPVFEMVWLAQSP